MPEFDLRARAGGPPGAAGSVPDRAMERGIDREQRAQAALAQVAIARDCDAGTDMVIDVVDAATLARTEYDDPGHSHDVATATAEVLAAINRWRCPLDAWSPVRWDAMGTVIPVLAASPGAGASVVAAALTDLLASSQRSVLLADTADPVRSGLRRSVRTDGPWSRGPHPHVSIRLSRRHRAFVARMDTELPVISPGMVPSPPWWRVVNEPLDATVVDVAHDAWRVAANPLVGAGAWLRHGVPSPRPILVCEPSEPSLKHAETVLRRLDAWSEVGALAPVERLVVVGARRWPRGVAGVAGRRLSTLVDDAVFVPRDPTVAAHGVTANTTSARLRNALRPVLTGLALPPPMGPRRHAESALASLPITPAAPAAPVAPVSGEWGVAR